MPRGYGDLFPGRDGKRDQSRGGGLSSRAVQEECHYPVFLADSENATLQLSDYLFPCLSACVNLGSKLSLGLTQVLLESGFFGICGGQEEFRASFHKKSIMLPGRCQVLDMCGLIPG